MNKNCDLNRYYKILKLLALIIFGYLLLNLVLTSQSTRKEKIDVLIKELTPTHSLQKSLNSNLEIIGYDVLDKNMNSLTFSKFKFHSGNLFYIVLYGKRIRVRGKGAIDNNLEGYNAFLEHQDGGYFWCTKTSFLIGGQEIGGNSKDWQIGGIYKVQFVFKIPEFALPGKYTLKIVKNKPAPHAAARLITIDKIK